MSETGLRYSFGAFTLDLPQLTLCRGGQPVKLGGRAANLLAVLAAAGGELVTRDRLLAEVWPGQAIDESAVRVHLSALRKALGDDRLVTNEAGRGYRLTVAVTRTSPATAPAEAPAPRPLVKLQGRADIVATLVAELPERRFLTLTGPGGIGKTSVALAAAAEAAARLTVSVRFVDFAPVSDPDLVEGTVATALGLPASGAGRFAAMAAELASGAHLLLLDNCEHLVDAAATLAERLLQSVPGLMILATSREPLRAAGEWVHRLPALATPDERAHEVADVLAAPAAALFVERARAARADFRIDESNASALADICRQLDGIPLALELAAARVDMMDLPALAGRLHDRLNLLTRGRRTALPRHRTLRAALDWSYELLEEPGKQLLMTLAVFRSGFAASDALGVAGGQEYEILDGLADLVSKSLVVTSLDQEGTRYRLLDTTRYYGLERLIEAKRERDVRARHARHLTTLFTDRQQAWEGRAPRDWLAAHSRLIDDVRGALDWGMGEEGDPALALSLIVASAALWFHLSLPHEFLSRAERILDVLENGGAADPAQRVELLAAYGHALWHTRGPVPEMGRAFDQALEIADSIGNEGLARRAQWGVWAHRILAGNYAESLTAAERFGARIGEQAAPAERQAGLRMRALSRHFAGEHGEAMELLQAAYAIPATVRVSHANHAQVDNRVAAASLHMRLAWLLGDIGQAMELAQSCAEHAIGTNHALSICYGLSIGCIPVAIAAGRREQALDWIEVLGRQTTRYTLDYWHAFTIGYGAALGRLAPLPDTISPMQLEMFAVAGVAEARDRLLTRPEAPSGWWPSLLPV